MLPLHRSRHLGPSLWQTSGAITSDYCMSGPRTMMPFLNSIQYTMTCLLPRFKVRGLKEQTLD